MFGWSLCKRYYLVFISPLFLMKCESNWDSLTDADFKILSRINKTTEHPNVIWGRDFIKERQSLLSLKGGLILSISK